MITDALYRRAGETEQRRDETMAACFRQIVNDVNVAIDFSTRHLGFKVEIHPAPALAEISRGDMHICLAQPSQDGGSAAMPLGQQQKQGGWNRSMFQPNTAQYRAKVDSHWAARSAGHATGQNDIVAAKASY